MSIESDKQRELDFSDIIGDFSARKSKKIWTEMVAGAEHFGWGHTLEQCADLGEEGTITKIFVWSSKLFK